MEATAAEPKGSTLLIPKAAAVRGSNPVPSVTHSGKPFHLNALIPFIAQYSCCLLQHGFTEESEFNFNFISLINYLHEPKQTK